MSAPNKSYLNSLNGLLSGACIVALMAGCSNGSPSKSETPAQPQQESQPQQLSDKKEEQKQPSETQSQPQQEAQPQKQAQPQPSTETRVGQNAPTSTEPSSDIEASLSAEKAVKAKVRQESEQLGFKIEIASDVTPSEAEQGLELLKSTVQTLKEGTRGRIEPLFDTVVLGHKNETAAEVNDQIRLTFAVSQSANPARYALKFEYAQCAPEAHGDVGSADRLDNCIAHPVSKSVYEFRKARVALADIRKDLAPVNLNCDQTTIVKCVIGARNFQEAKPFVHKEMLDIIRVLTIRNRNPMTVMYPLTFSLTEDGFLSVNSMYKSIPKAVATGINRSAVGLNQ